MKRNIMRSLLLLLLIAFAFVSCYKVPGSIYTPVNPEEENAKRPKITSVDKTFAFTDETVTISGENFSEEIGENFVYFSSVSEPVVGDTTESTETLTSDATITVTTDFKTITITTSGLYSKLSTTIDGVTTVDDSITAPIKISEYTTTDDDKLVLTSVETFPDAGSGVTEMVKTVTSYNNITDWICHSNKPGTITSASKTELKVIPPDVDAIKSRITVHVQTVIAPTIEKKYIDLMQRP